MNTTWAIAELQSFIAVCDRHTLAWDTAGGNALHNPAIKELHQQAIALIPLTTQIVDRAWPDWRSRAQTHSKFGGWEYDELREVAMQSIVLLRRKEELESNLESSGPKLSANTMHPHVWNASKSLWESGHYGEAVVSASRSVNALLQAKVGRRDVSEAKLVAECFSLDDPKLGSPRLRLMANDTSDTYKNMHLGALAYGQGCFRAIRNVLAHEYGALAEPPEEEALHYLASFSVLARWVDRATVVSA